MAEAKSVQEQFFKWLSREASPTQLSELYIVYADIESFCIQRKILKNNLFETTNLNIVKAVLNTVESNKVFRFTYKRDLRRMSSAMHFYHRFLKEHPELSNKPAHEEPIVHHETIGSNHLENIVQREKVPATSAEILVDFSSSEKLAFTKPISFSYFGEVQANSGNWTQVYVSVVACLWEDYPDILEAYLNKNIGGQGRSDFADKSNSKAKGAPKKKAEKFYLETNLSATDIVAKIQHLLDLCNVDYENVEIRYIKKKTGSTPPPDTATVAETVPVQAEDDVRAQRVALIDWMRKSGSSTSIVFSCLSAIGQCSKAVEEYGIFTDDLLLVKDAGVLSRMKTALFAVPAFRELNVQQHNRFHAAFNKLIAFRTDIESAVVMETRPEVRIFEVPQEPKQATTANSITEETYTRYTNILVKYFGEDGYQPGRAIFRGRFKKNYAAEYGVEPEESDERIDGILSQLGTQRDGRIFPKQDEEQNSLLDVIIADVLDAFESGASAVYINAVYDKYQQQLANSLQIYHVDALTPLLLAYAKGKYSQKYSYLTPNWKNADSAGDILRVMKGFHEPVTYDAIHTEVWYIPYDKMKSLMVWDKSIVNVAVGTYFYAPNLPVSSDDLKQLIKAIQQELDYRSYITDVEMMTIIQAKCPSIAINTEGYTTYGLRNCLGYILREHFSFNGPIISAVCSELRMGDVYAEFARAHEVLQFQDLKNLSSEMNIGIYWDSVLGEMIRVSESELIRKDLISFDIDAIDAVLDGMCPGDYVPLKDISLFLYFPNIGYPWNSYILESYLFSCSRKFKLLHASFGKNSVYGAMVRVDSPIIDYRSLLVDVLANSNAPSSTKAALQYIVDRGFQQRPRYDAIEQLIHEAKLLKEQKEKQEK